MTVADPGLEFLELEIAKRASYRIQGLYRA